MSKALPPRVRTRRSPLFFLLILTVLSLGALVSPVAAVEVGGPAAYEAARTLFSQGKYDDAIAALARVKEDYPLQAASAQRMIGCCYQWKGDFDRAILEYENLLSDYPSSDAAKQAHFWIGACYESKSLPEQAAAEFQEQIRLAPRVKMAETVRKLANYYLSKGDKTRAKALIDNLRSQRGSLTDQNEKAAVDLQIGDYLMGTSDSQGAMEHYQSIRASYPDRDEDILYHIAIAARDAGKHDIAISAAMEYSNDYPDNPRVDGIVCGMIKSMVARSNGDWELGFGQIASVKEKHPKYAEHILFEIGKAAMGAGRYGVSSRAFRQHVQEYTDSPRTKEAKLLLEESLRNLGQYDASLDLLRSAAAGGGEIEPDALLRQAEILGQNKNDTNAAFDICNRLVEKFPENTELMGLVEFTRGQLYLSKLRNPVKAREHFQNLITQYPSRNLSVEAACHVASSYYAESNYSKAQTLFEKAATDYESPVKCWRGYARFMVGDCLFRQGKMDEAKGVWQSVVTEYTDCDWAKAAQGKLDGMKDGE